MPLFLACLLLAACAGSGREEAVVEFWAMGREGELVQELVPGFEERHPGVRVRVQQIPWSAAHEKIVTAYAGGAMPDVLQVGNTWIAELAVLGAIEPLGKELAASGSGAREDWFPGVLEAGVVDGRTWALPWYVDTRLLFYRSDLLERAGAAQPPRTWSDWMEVMTRIREAGDSAHAILLPLGEWETPVILALQNGSHLLADDDTRAAFQTPEFRGAFEFYVDLFRKGLAPTGSEAQAGSVYQGFAEGLFAFLVTGPWNLREFRDRLPAELASDWTTAPMPAREGEGPGVSLALGASLAVARTSTHREESWRWVEYLTEPAQQIAFYRSAGDLPARRSAWSDGGITEDPRAASFFAQLARVVPPPRIPEWERIAARIAQHAEAAIRGDATIDTALAALDADADRILEKRRWLRARDASDASDAAADGAVNE
ncbi:MAG: extracellular solute-binding protein [Deltaproteobacteria bacterium]|nr:extracellular solute-binding protein [Deltaproteobacteria bacterium]